MAAESAESGHAHKLVTHADRSNCAAGSTSVSVPCCFVGL